MKNDHFAEKSKVWDLNPMIVNNAKEIAKCITHKIELSSSMHLMDFGAGTGLLSYFIATEIEKITAVDNSASMLNKLQEKKDTFECEIISINKDLSTQTLDETFDGIISSMTIHHLEDINALFSKFYAMLDKGGFIALSDLYTEDGSFHSDNRGVFHYGFEKDTLIEIAKKIGFKEIEFQTVTTIHKPHGDFTIFLMTAYK